MQPVISSISISVLVLTKNEETSLPGCLESVSWSDDIHIYDSFSEDNTVGVAQQYNTTITQRKFDNYASQRNSAIHGLSFKYPWVLILDADERIPNPLASEIKEYISRPCVQTVAGRICRRDYFRGTWLKHAQMSPFYIRLVQPSKVHYEREVNEVLKVDGLIHDFKEPFDHYPFLKGIAHWIEKHNQYSTLEADQLIQLDRGNFFLDFKNMILCSDFNDRRFYQKKIFYRMPFRPLIKLFYLMFFRLAFLDGMAGINYVFLLIIYEYLIILKIQELNASE